MQAGPDDMPDQDTLRSFFEWPGNALAAIGIFTEQDRATHCMNQNLAL